MFGNKSRETAWDCAQKEPSNTNFIDNEPELDRGQDEIYDYYRDIQEPYVHWKPGEGKTVYDKLAAIYNEDTLQSEATQIPRKNYHEDNRYQEIDDFTTDTSPQDVLLISGSQINMNKESQHWARVNGSFLNQKDIFKSEAKTNEFLKKLKTDAQLNYFTENTNPFSYDSQLPDQRSYLRSLNIAKDDKFFSKPYPVALIAKIVDSVEFVNTYTDLMIFKGQNAIFKQMPSDLNHKLFPCGMNFVTMETEGDQLKPTKYQVIYDIDPFHKTKIAEVRQRIKEFERSQVMREMTKTVLEQERHGPKSQHEEYYITKAQQKHQMLSNQKSSSKTTATEVDGIDTKIPNPDGGFPDISNLDAWTFEEEDDEIDPETIQFANYVAHKGPMIESPQSSTSHPSGYNPGLEKINLHSTEISEESEVLRFMLQRAEKMRMPTSYTIDDQKLRETLTTKLRIVVTLGLEEDEDVFWYEITGFFYYIKE